MVGHAFRIAAFCDAYYFLRHGELLLLHHLEVSDDVHGSLRCYEGKLVELLVLEELVLYLVDTLASLSLAVEVDSYGDLVPDALEVKQVQGLIYVFRRNMVQYGAVFQCAYYQFFSCHMN